jgi:hypothetical protein
MATLDEVLTRLLDPNDGLNQQNPSVATMAAIYDNEGIASWFNARPMIANPNQQEMVPKPIKNIFVLTDMLSDPTEVATFKENLELLRLQPYMSGLVSFESTSTIDEFCAAVKGLSEESKAAILAECKKTIPDPNWQAQIPGPTRYTVLEVPGPVTASQVHNFLNQ